MQPTTANQRAHLMISGVVQGVTFRASTQEQALARGVKGWVTNLADGRVEAVFEGPTDAVEALVSWCHEGPPRARVDNVDVTYEAARGEFESFEVRYEPAR